MSVETRQYPQVKVEPPSKKVEYTRPQAWGVSTNKRLSNTQVWRK